MWPNVAVAFRYIPLKTSCFWLFRLCFTVYLWFNSFLYLTTVFDKFVPKPCLPPMVPHFIGRQQEHEDILRVLTSTSVRIWTPHPFVLAKRHWLLQ